MLPVLFVFGTRPEAIKLAPLIKVFANNEKYQVKVCVTAQHREMLDQVLNFFSIQPDYDLNLMKPGQSLFQITSNALTALEPVLHDAKPEVVFVQGDTTTSFVGALAATYNKIKVAHVEAGLRTQNKSAPFPEEINRQLTARLSDYHFAPTAEARQNLFKENITKNVYVVGNTVIDALYLGLSIIKRNGLRYRARFSSLDFTKKIILVTCHRRENFGKPFRNICQALADLALDNSQVEFVYPVHLNPNIKEAANQWLQLPNIKLIDPLDYPHLVWLLSKSYLVLTDSGGLQEEAPALGKPVLVLRDVTERMEGVLAGTARLVGTDKEKIVKTTQQLLEDKDMYDTMSKSINPYGNGMASSKTLQIITENFYQLQNSF